MDVATQAISRELATPRTALSTRVIRSREEVAPIWRALYGEVGANGLASSWDWVECWLDAYGDAIQHWFVLGTFGGRVIGVALLTRGLSQRRGPLPLRTVHIGTAGEAPTESVTVEYNRVLVQPRFRSNFLASLLRAPGSARWSADAIVLNDFAPEELPRSVIAGLRAQERICYTAQLQPARHGAATLLDTFDGDTRRKIRKNMKRFTEKFGPIQSEWVDESARAQAVMDELVAHHQTRWTSAGEPGAFASARFQAFHRSVIDRLLGKGQIALVRVTAGETLVGIFYGFIENGAIYHYQWGLPQFEESSLSPGFVTGYKVMDDAASWGLAEINWLVGESRFKREMSNATRTLVWAETGLSPWFTAVNGMIRIKHAMRGRT